MPSASSSNEYDFVFDRPDDRAIGVITAMLRTLPAAPARAVGRRHGRATVTGDAEMVVAALRAHLDADFARNTAECRSAPWRFEYVADKCADRPGLLLVLTRLYHATEAGGVMYGSEILRTGQDEFRLWIEE